MTVPIEDKLWEFVQAVASASRTEEFHALQREADDLLDSHPLTTSEE